MAKAPLLLLEFVQAPWGVNPTADEFNVLLEDKIVLLCTMGKTDFLIFRQVYEF